LAIRQISLEKRYNRFCFFVVGLLHPTKRKENHASVFVNVCFPIISKELKQQMKEMKLFLDP